MKNARAVGTERDGKVFVQNDYTGRELRIDTASIRHGLNGSLNRLLTNARLGANIGTIVKSAVPINALRNKASGVTGTYAMAAYATDRSGREFVAIITVEQKTGDVADVSAYDVTHSVSGRQKTRDAQVDTKSQGVYPSMNVSKVKIADFLNIVNSTHQSILSGSVLKKLGKNVQRTDITQKVQSFPQMQLRRKTTKRRWRISERHTSGARRAMCCWTGRSWISPAGMRAAWAVVVSLFAVYSTYKRDSPVGESLLYVRAHRVSSNRALRWEAIWLCFSDG